MGQALWTSVWVARLRRAPRHLMGQALWTVGRATQHVSWRRSTRSRGALHAPLPAPALHVQARGDAEAVRLGESEYHRLPIGEGFAGCRLRHEQNSLQRPGELFDESARFVHIGGRRDDELQPRTFRSEQRGQRLREDATVAGSAPGREALTRTMGKSTRGTAATGMK